MRSSLLFPNLKPSEQPFEQLNYGHSEEVSMPTSLGFLVGWHGRYWLQESVNSTHTQSVQRWSIDSFTSWIRGVGLHRSC